ncbi:MAG: hypothetical protein H7Z71_05800, partial [Moraxellaceae bacterium]|nr:hypothetical protein [Pseudobdellovibrionaceae bacterium]
MKSYQFLLGFGMVIFAQTTVFAKTETISINAKSISVQNVGGFGTFSKNVFSKINVPGFESTQELGKASLPVKTWILMGRPENIQVQVQVQKTEVFQNVIPLPTQAQPCRCATDKKINFAYDQAAYSPNRFAGPINDYNLVYLGAYKGQPITQLNVKLAHFDAATSEVILNTGVTVSYNTNEFSLQNENLKNYLIITPDQLAAGLIDFVTWKKSQGYNVVVEKLSSPNTTTSAVLNLVQDYYNRRQADFVMIIGDDKAVP